MSTATTSAYDAAYQYRTAGLQVVPIRADGSKAPAAKELQPLLYGPAQCELSAFQGHVGVAIICGPVSGNLEVIDFDDPTIYEPWCEAVEELSPGLVQRLVIVHTPRCTDGLRGAHVYYRHSGTPQGSHKLAMGESGARIETKALGGYVLAPGSPPECHETGRTYDLTAGDLSDLPTVTAEERGAMLQAAKSFGQLPEGVIGDDSQATNGQLSPGSDYGNRADWESILGPKWTKVGADLWRRPGKSKGWSASTKCTSKHGNSLFHVPDAICRRYTVRVKKGKWWQVPESLRRREE